MEKENDCRHAHSEEEHCSCHKGRCHEEDSREPDGGCGCGHCNFDAQEHDHGSEPASRGRIILLSLSAALFVTAILLPYAFPAFGQSGWQSLIYLSSALISGFELFWNGIKKLVRFRFDEEVLLLIAVIASFILGEYPEACIVTILFVLGEFLEATAIRRSKKSMEKLTEIRPDYAYLKNAEGGFDAVRAEEVRVGDTVWLRAGDKAALDCEVISGNSSINASALTGEAAPFGVSPGSEVLSGSVNLTGVLECRVTKSFENSTASQIVSMVYDSMKKKGKAETFISRFAKIYTPIVILLAVLIALLPPLLGLGTWHDFIMRSLIFLVASCPCALVISIPLSFFAAIGASARLGVLVKGSKYIETLARTQAVCLDKTGTLTSGRLRVDEVAALNGRSRDEILTLAANIEQNSTHPISACIVDYAGEYERLSLNNTAELAGLGLSAEWNGKKYFCGGPNLLRDLGIDRGGLPEANVYLCEGTEIIGYITLAEEIAEENLSLVEDLRRTGVDEVVMLTGDNEKNAAAIAAKYGVTSYRAGLLPKDKVTAVEEVRSRGRVTLFVGDGINDAPVIAAADLGGSMGLGSEIANVSSDIILVGNRLSVLPKAIRLARRSMAIVRGNIIFALAVKFAVLLLGALGYGSMWLAVFADIGVTILSVLNSLRIMGFGRKTEK